MFFFSVRGSSNDSITQLLGRRINIENSDIEQGKDDLFVRAFDSMSCYQKVQQKILATNFNSANIARHPLGARKHTKSLGVKR